MSADPDLPVISATSAAGGFHTTRWTQVLQASEPTAEGVDALRDLCAAYYAPVIAFLRRRGNDPEAARELAHAFFAGLLEGGAIGGVNQEQGRFRSYLLGAVKHFLAHRWEAEQRQRRGGGVAPLSLDAALEGTPVREIPDHAQLSPEAAFDRQWAVTVLARAMATLQAEGAASGRSQLFEQAHPWLIGEAAHGDQGALAESLGLSVGAVKVAVHRLKKRYRELIKAEIARTLRDDTMVAEEMRALFIALGG